MLEVIKYIYRLAVHFSNRTLKKWSFHVVYKIVVLLILKELCHEIQPD